MSLSSYRKAKLHRFHRRHSQRLKEENLMSLSFFTSFATLWTPSSSSLSTWLSIYIIWWQHDVVTFPLDSVMCFWDHYMILFTSITFKTQSTFSLFSSLETLPSENNCIQAQTRERGRDIEGEVHGWHNEDDENLINLTGNDKTAINLLTFDRHTESTAESRRRLKLNYFNFDKAHNLNGAARQQLPALSCLPKQFLSNIFLMVLRHSIYVKSINCSSVLLYLKRFNFKMIFLFKNLKRKNRNWVSWSVMSNEDWRNWLFYNSYDSLLRNSPDVQITLKPAQNRKLSLSFCKAFIINDKRWPTWRLFKTFSCLRITPQSLNWFFFIRNTHENVVERIYLVIIFLVQINHF